MPHILLGEPAFARSSEQLSSLGFTPIALPKETRLNKTVATHADTLIFSDGNVHIINEDYLTFLPAHVHGKMTAVSESPRGNYPTDTTFNAVRIGRTLFAGKSIAAAVRQYSEDAGLKLVNVNQGYARCSVLPLPSARAAITADEGMARSMEAEGVDVLRIEKAHIALEGCEYGFIGGASFVWEPTACCSLSHFRRFIYFFGSLRSHPSCDAIREFAKKRGYETVCLDGVLTDFGGAVVI